MELQKPFEPHFLNIDYVFNLVYEFFLWVYIKFDQYIFGGSLPGGAPSLSSPEVIAEGEQIFTGNTDFVLLPFLSSLKVWLSIAAVFFLTIIIYCLVRLYEIRREEKEALMRVIPIPPEATAKNEQWEKVVERVNSTNPSDWKLAILEADSMLDDMVRRMGYRGENLGERLKAVEPSDFSNIQSAWEAHKVRNRIAHEGSEFFLSQREARRIVGLYEAVFREFQFI